MDRDDVSLGKELIHGHVLGIGNSLDPVVRWVSVKAQNLKKLVSFSNKDFEVVYLQTG